MRRRTGQYDSEPRRWTRSHARYIRSTTTSKTFTILQITKTVADINQILHNSERIHLAEIP